MAAQIAVPGSRAQSGSGRTGRQVSSRQAMSKTTPQPSPYEAAPAYPRTRADFHQTSVINAQELARMDMPDRKMATYEYEVSKKEALRKASQSRYKNWGNTLEALREKKKRDRHRDLAKRETDQMKLDDAEAELRETARRAAIDKANRLLFKGNDRVKSFQSSMLLSTVMQERYRQIEHKRKKKAHNEQMDEMWLQIQQENLEQQYKKEELEDKSRKQKSLALAKTQLVQLQEMRTKHKRERLVDIREGERNKRIAEQALREAREEERLRKDKMLENNKEYLRANLEQRKIKSERARLEKLEDARIAEFASEKERLANLRKEAENARYALKAHKYEEMLARHHDQVQNVREAERARMQRQTKEVEERNNAYDAAEKLRNDTLRADIEKSRANQIGRRKREEQRQKLEDQVRTDEWLKRAKELEEIEKQQEAAEKRAALEYQAYLNEQKAERNYKSSLERTNDMEAARYNQQRHREEDEVFQNFAQTKIREYAAKGRTVVPMKLDLMKHERAKRRVTSCP